MIYLYTCNVCRHARDALGISYNNILIYSTSPRQRLPSDSAYIWCGVHAYRHTWLYVRTHDICMIYRRDAACPARPKNASSVISIITALRPP